MMFRLVFAIMTVLLCSIPVAAAPLKVSVAEFKVTGAAGKDELKGALQSMLSSRLAGDNLQVVGADDSPDMTIIGTYIVFGKVFSIDGHIVGRNGKTLGRVFEQGDGADDVIPAIGRVAQKLTAEIGKLSSPVVAKSGTNSSPPQAVAVVPPAPAAAPTDIVRPLPVEQAKIVTEIIRPEKVARSGESGMIGQRLDGVMLGLAQVKRTGSESRELVVALDRELRLYRQDKSLLLAETEKGFGSNEKIIGLDAADLDRDGTLELYVTAFNGDQLASRVYLLENGKFKKIAANLPYYFRGISLRGEGLKIYAQQAGVSEDFFGDLFEVVKNGTSFTIRNPIKLPKFATIFNMNLLPDRDGKNMYVVLHPDGYLLVYDENGENIWKSSDKFGGSTTFFAREEVQNMSFTGTKEAKRFIEQRITVTKNGEVIVPKNEGNFVIGDNRFFNKSSVFAFAWKGAALEELWHTKVSQNYMADYGYDSEEKELVMLEVVKKAGVVEKGASAVVIKKVE